jgi:drug/metabolite transporter (DMT)-like permease
LDSGIAIDDSLVVPVRVAPTTQAPRAVHGATEAPIVHSVDVDALELYGEAELTGWRQALFFLPALFDLTATTLMNVGLLFTPVSIYQMTRSALVLFVGAFSVVYLGRRLNRTEVLSLCVVTLGVFIVGLSGAKASDATAAETEGVSRVVGGILLILFAQLFTAAQFVVEEKIMSRYAVEPLRAVGLEGVFGFGTTLTLMVAMFFLVGRNEAGMGGPFDVRVGFREIVENREVWLSSLAICLSIGLFNFVRALSMFMMRWLTCWAVRTGGDQDVRSVRVASPLQLMLCSQCVCHGQIHH